MTLHCPQRTTVWAWLKTVVIWKHPGHLMSMKKLLGDCTRRFNLWVEASWAGVGFNRSTAIIYTVKVEMIPVRSSVVMNIEDTKKERMWVLIQRSKGGNEWYLVFHRIDTVRCLRDVSGTGKVPLNIVVCRLDRKIERRKDDKESGSKKR